MLVHLDPVWRHRANYLAHVRLDDPLRLYEQLWLRDIDGSKYEVCCIPLSAYDLSLGDIVTLDGGFVLEVVARSGRATFHVVIEEAHHQTGARLQSELEGLAALVEWYSVHRFGAVDAADNTSAKSVLAYLAELQASGELFFELAAGSVD